MDHPLIELKNVSKKFGWQVVLKDVNLTIHRGEVTTVIGKSGEGKSVLLKHIIGLMEPDSGEILFKGIPVSRLSKREKRTMRKNFSYMFQSNALFDSLTVFDNIALPLVEANSRSEREIGKAVFDKMAQLDLKDIEEKYPSQLSGGMRKRVALARALVTDPEIILFDEPTTGLDPIRKNAVHSMISDYQKKFEFTAIVVSHEIPDIFYISQGIAMLEDGQIIHTGTPEEFQQIKDPVVQNFIRGLESRHDDLTGMAPQTQGEKRFTEEMARLQRYHITFSVIIFTIENFEEINEIAGHVAGQRILQNFATELQNCLRITDTCSRYGLNKIMAVLPNTTVDQARLTCSKISSEEKIKEIMEVHPDRGFCLEVSVGLAEIREDSSLANVIDIAESNQNRLFDYRVCGMGEL